MVRDAGSCDKRPRTALRDYRVLGSRLGAALALSIGLTGCTEQLEPVIDVAPGAARGADIILITLDTTRADHIGCFSATHSVTPVIDRLCANGIAFDNAHTVAPITLPAHASILSGLYPPHHGARYNGEFHVRDDVDTLAERLQGQGYETAAFVSSFVLDGRFGLRQGFDHYDDAVATTTGGAFSAGHNERSGAATNAAALRYLEQRDRSKPLFLWVHYYDPHAPYQPQDATQRTSVPVAYRAEIADTDTHVGQLLASPALDLPKSVLLVMADHGESLGEHGEATHSIFIYESTTRIPLLLHAPALDLPKGQKESTLVSVVDVVPTLLDLVGASQSASTASLMDGLSWLKSRRAPSEGVYMESSSPYFEFGFSPLYALRGSSNKLISAPTPEYFDLTKDPHELSNLFASLDAEQRPLADALQGKLDALQLSWPDLTVAAQLAAPKDAEVLERLRSLGYIGGDTPGAEATLDDPKDRAEVIQMERDAALATGMKDWRRVLLLAHEAEQLAPPMRAMLKHKAKAHLRLGMLEQAEATLRQSLDIKPVADDLVLMAQLLILRKDLAEAAKLLDQAEALDARHGGVPMARGDMARMQGQLDEAETHYRQAMERDPFRARGAAEARIQAMRKPAPLENVAPQN